LSNSRIGEILVSHLPAMETCWKVYLIRQSHLTNLQTAKNGFMLFKKKTGGPPVYQPDYLSFVLIPLRIQILGKFKIEIKTFYGVIKEPR
jgi:hypothetical protein